MKDAMGVIEMDCSVVDGDPAVPQQLATGVGYHLGFSCLGCMWTLLPAVEEFGMSILVSIDLGDGRE